MNADLDEPLLASAAEAWENHEVPLRAQVWGLLAGMYPHAERSERRREERFPYPCMLYLTPVGEDGVTRLGEVIVVAGKHLSERGLGFYHSAPLPHRLVVASLEKEPDDWLHLLLDVSWCRFRREGWYESGGRFLRSVPWPTSKAG